MGVSIGKMNYGSNDSRNYNGAWLPHSKHESGDVEIHKWTIWAVESDVGSGQGLAT